MAGIKIVNLPALGRNLASTDLFELSLAGGTGSRKITGQEIINGIPLPPSGLNIGTTAITSGTVGRVLFEGTGNVVQQSSQISWNNSTNALTVTTGKIFSAYQSGSTANDALKITASNDGAVFGIQNSNAGGFSGIEYLNTAGISKVFTGFNNINGQEFRFNNFASGGYIDFLISATSAFRIFNTRNIGIGTTTDAGYKLDVNGTARVSGVFTTSIINNLALTTGGFGTTGYGLAISNGMTFAIDQGSGGYNFGYWFGLSSASNWNTLSKSGIKVGLGASTPNISNITYTSVDIIPTFNTDFSGKSGNIVRGIYYNPTITSFINGVRNQMRAFESSLGGAYFNTTAVDGSAILQADSTTQGFLPPRMTTTQKNAIASPATGLELFDSTTLTPSVFNGTNWQNLLVPNSNGNVLINTTTDAGYKLDVNGTARVQGDVTVTGTRVSISNAAMSIDANVGTGYYNIRNNSGSAGTTAITLGGNTYLNIYQPISASSGITAGTLNTITTPLTYAWASGTASPNLFQLNPNYNFTGTYTGTARGFYYNPTLTSIVGLTHFAFHSTSGRVRFEGLPTSPTGLNAGDLYNNLGVLMIV